MAAVKEEGRAIVESLFMGAESEHFEFLSAEKEAELLEHPLLVNEKYENIIENYQF